MASPRRRFLQAAAAGLASSVAASRRAAGQPAPAGSGGQLRRPAADEIVLAFVGDLFLTRELPPGDDAAASAVRDTLRSANAGFANLENGLSTRGSGELGGFRHGGAIRGHPSLVTVLRETGVTAVSLANNHSGNFGPEALVETIETLDAAGIGHAGAGRTIDEAFAPAMLTARDRRIALISVYTYYSNFQANDSADATHAGVAACRAYEVALQVPTGYDTSRRDESPYRLGLAANPVQIVMAPLKDDLDRLTAAVRRARQQASVVVVSAHIHWGRHGAADIPFQQRTLAQATIDAGADLFIGHGPHTLRGLEFYRGKPIAYSLCNFMLMPQRPGAAPPRPGVRDFGRESAVLRVAIAKDGKMALELLPIMIALDCRPRFATGADADRINERLTGLSATLGTELKQEGWRLVATT